MNDPEGTVSNVLCRFCGQAIWWDASVENDAVAPARFGFWRGDDDDTCCPDAPETEGGQFLHRPSSGPPPTQS